MSTSDELLTATHDIRERILAHPVVRGIGSGDLPLAPFRYYVRQDYAFLIEYTRVLALAVARAHDLSVMALFARLVQETLEVEMELHRGYCARLGITREDLEATEPSPTTRAYTDHLLRVAWQASTIEIMAALLPCQWGYWEIGRELAGRGLPAHQPLYAEWIAMYSGAEYRDLAAHLRATFDGVAEGVSLAEHARLDTIFRTSSRYEYAFWDAALREETWPV